MGTGNETALTHQLPALKVAIDASLDAACIVDRDGRIQSYNSSLKHMLQMPVRQLESHPVLCDALTLSVCKHACQIKEAIEIGAARRFDETPAVIQNQKVRILLKVTPIFDSEQKTGKASGAIITIRDTTAELLLHAKYLKLQKVIKEKDSRIEEKDSKIEELSERLQKIRDTLRTVKVKTKPE